MRYDMPCVETKRLYLRPIEESDACDLFRYLKLEETMRYLSHPIHKNVDQTLCWIQRDLLPYAQQQDFETLVLVLKEEDKVIGHMRFHSMNEERAQVAYVLDPNYWRQGYASEALQALVAIGFHHCGLKRIEALYALHNEASGKVLKKNHFQIEGKLRKYEVLNDGNYHDMVITSLLSSEYSEGEEYEKRTKSKV